MSEGASYNLLKSFVPTKTVAAVLVTIASGLFVGGMWLATINLRGEANAATLEEVQETLKDYPTRNEFNDVKKSVDRIETGVNELRTVLLQKK